MRKADPGKDPGGTEKHKEKKTTSILLIKKNVTVIIWILNRMDTIFRESFIHWDCLFLKLWYFLFRVQSHT